jgi:hypothetical protein
MSFWLDQPDLAMLQSFIKIEKNDYTKTESDPRLIQARSREFNILAFQFIKPIERALFGPCATEPKTFAKGRNLLERAEDIVSIWGHFRNPVCVGIDCKRFDQHHNSELLDIELSVYQKLGYPKVLADMHRHNMGKYHGGRYETEGLRMSGDPITAIGNVITMYLLLSACLTGQDYKIYDDGDDCLVFFERERLTFIQDRLTEFFTGCGHELKFERIAFTIADIRFCQSAVIFYGDVPFMVRDPYKTVSTLLFCKRDPTSQEGREYMTAVAVGLLNSNRGVPIVDDICQAIIKLGYTSDIDPDTVVPYSHRGIVTPENWDTVPGQIADAFGESLLGHGDFFKEFTFPSYWLDDGPSPH